MDRHGSAGKSGAVLAAGHGRTGIHDVATTPDGGVWFSAQRSGHLGWFDPKIGRTELIALRKGSSPHGVIQGPDKAAWPGDAPKTYVVYVDERDKVWLSDFGGNAALRFDPEAEKFERFAFPREATNIRQILGRAGEVWLPESGTEHITVIRTA
ncbi:MAG: hypothetical protein H0U56_08480 [Methylibium sp.]|nr:hypothetical protein [Methylibium sp.]